MKNTLNITICAASIVIMSLCASCSDNTAGNKTTAADTTARPNYPKMSAKERLAKNNILEKHMNWERKNLKGRVNSFSKKTYETDAKSGSPKKLISSEDARFDTRGNIIESDYFYSHTNQGSLRGKVKFMYDANDNDTGSYSCDSTGKFSGRGSNKYDSRGNEIDEFYAGANGKMKHRGSYKYDDRDNLIELDLYNDSGLVDGKWMFTYDDNGFKTGSVTYDEAGKNDSKTICKFDDKGDNLNNITYKSDGSIRYIDSSKYDDKGHRIEDVIYDGHDTLISKYIMKYDDKGNQTERIITKADGSINENNSFYKEYEYDATGNIIKEKEYKFKDGKKTLADISEITIVYY